MPVREDPYHIVSLYHCIFGLEVENFPCGADAEDFIIEPYFWNNCFSLSTYREYITSTVEKDAEEQ